MIALRTILAYQKQIQRPSDNPYKHNNTKNQSKLISQLAQTGIFQNSAYYES